MSDQGMTQGIGQKLPYHTPQVVDHGDVASITATNPGNVTADDGAGAGPPYYS